MAEENIVVTELDDADRTQLTPQEEARLQELTAQIKIDDSGYVAGYGADAQDEVRNAAIAALGNTRIGEIDSVNKLVNGIDRRVRDFKAVAQAKHFLAVLMGEAKYLRRKFQPVQKYVQGCESDLDRLVLLFGADIAADDSRYEANQKSSRKLLVYVRAGRAALQTARETTLARMKARAEETKSRDDIQAAARFEDQCNAFEFHLADLEKSRTVAFLRGPQIDMQKKSKSAVQSTLNNMKYQSIPILLDGMAAALGLSHLRKGIQLADKTRQTTDSMIQTVAELTGQGAIESAEARGRGVFSLEAVVAAVNTYIADSVKYKEAVNRNLERARSASMELAKLEERLSESLLG